MEWVLWSFLKPGLSDYIYSVESILATDYDSLFDMLFLYMHYLITYFRTVTPALSFKV